MAIAGLLSQFTFRQISFGATAAIQMTSAEAVTNFLGERLFDQSGKMIVALEQANLRAWKSLEVALAGETLWNKLDPAADKSFRQQIREYLDSTPFGNLSSHGEEFRKGCLHELREARKAGLLLRGGLSPEQIIEQIASFAAFTEDAEMVEKEWQTLNELENTLRTEGFPTLAHFVSLKPDNQTPLIIIGVRFFFRRAVEKDEQLHRALTFAQWQPLAASQKQGFEQLEQLLTTHGQQMDQMLDLLSEMRDVVLDLRKEITGQREQIQHLAQNVVQVLEQHQLEQREVRADDSLSIRNEEERRLVKQLVQEYRGLPTDQREKLPAMLNAVGKLEIVVGNFASARQDFQEVARLSLQPQEKAEAHYNAYQAALEQRDYATALSEIQSAASLDAERFAPFPLHKYQPEVILGAGGFGVAFLCLDRHSGARVVVKTLRVDDLDRSVSEVFAEGRALEEVNHPGIIRLRYCDYADREGRHPYLVMDHFEGQTLADFVEKQGTLAVDEALNLLRSVAEALSAAHQKGILHRDIKPANLLIKPLSGDKGSRQWSVKLIDFGLALKRRVVQSTLSQANYQTETILGSSVAGTMDYAAPEQMGKLAGVPIGPYSDIYGLGKTLCYALFGTTQPLPRHWRTVSEEVADLLGHCLAEAPEDRPASCGEVLDKIRLHQKPTPTPVASVAPPKAIPISQPTPQPEVDAGVSFPQILRWLIGIALGGYLGMVLGLIGGSTGVVFSYRGEEDLFTFTMCGAIVCAFGTFFTSRASVPVTIALFFIGGGLGAGTLALAHAISWEWGMTIPYLLLAFVLWGWLWGFIWGKLRGNAMIGAPVGVLLTLLTVGGGLILRHPDSGAIWGLSLGVFVGPMIWFSLKPKAMNALRWCCFVVPFIMANVLGFSSGSLGTSFSLQALDSSDSTLGIGQTFYQYTRSNDVQLRPAFSVDGNKVIAHTGKEVQVWDVRSGELINSLALYLPDGPGKSWRDDAAPDLMALGFTSKGEGQIVSVEKMKLIRRSIGKGEDLGPEQDVTHPETKRSVNSLSLSPNGQFAILTYGTTGRRSSSSGTNKVGLAVANLSQNQLNFFTLGEENNSETITCAAITSDGQKAILGYSDGSVKLWEINSTTPNGKNASPAKELRASRKLSESIQDISLSSDGQHAVAMSDYAMTWNVDQWSDFQVFSGEFRTVSLSGEGSRFLGAGYHDAITLRNTANGEKVRSYRHHTSTLLSLGGTFHVALSPNGLTAMSQAREDRRIYLWKLPSSDAKADEKEDGTARGDSPPSSEKDKSSPPSRNDES